jgi:hypothetical protein
MGKYTRPYLHPQSRIKRIPIHPVWRGLGCLLIILIPIISFAAARLLVQANSEQGWIVIPDELAGAFSAPFVGVVTYTDLAVTMIVLIVFFGLATILYSMVYRLFGPPRYGPLDSPPQ